MFSLKNKIKELSLLKLAGIKNICVIEVHGKHIVFSHIMLKTKISDILNNRFNSIIVKESFSIRATENVRELENSLFKLTDKINRNKTYFLIATSHCRHKLFSIPKSAGDVETWIAENKKKILSDIVNPDQFLYSYEIISEDEDNICIVFTISRKDHIEFYTSLLAKHNLKILAITSVNLASISSLDEEKGCLLVVPVEDKIIYSYYDGKKDFISDEMFYLSDEEDAAQKALLQIKETVFNKRNKSAINIKILLNCSNNQFARVRERLSDIFNDAPINEGLGSDINEHTAINQIIKKYVENYDNSTNLLQEEMSLSSREEIEKESALKVILSISAIILILLLLLNIFNYIIGAELAENEEYIAERKSKQELLDRMTSDKAALNKKLNLLNNLKWKRTNYSLILQYVSEAVPEGSLLTSLKATDTQNGYVALELEGLAKGQEDVSLILSRLESRKRLKNVVLLNSGRADSILVNKNRLSGVYLNYKVTCTLNDDKK